MNPFRFFLIALLLIFYVIPTWGQTPLAQWKLDESAGMTAKERISGTEFRIKNDFPKPESEHVSGVSNQCLRFNGYATWIEGECPSSLPADQVTVTAWVAPEVYPFSSAAIFTNAGNNSGIYLGVDRFGRLEIGATSNGFYSQKISTQKIPHYKWSFLAMTADPAEGKLRGYVDGVLVAEQTLHAGPLNWNSSGAIKIGKHQNSALSGIFETGLFCGLIDEVTIYGKALSQMEVQSLFNKEKPNKAPDLSVPSTRFAGDLHRPVYHGIPPANWMNEPHGLIYFNGGYHIFYQKNGNGPYWGRLNWGRQTSPDLITWTEQPVALFPDPSGYDQEGCWSGVSMQKDGNAFIMYTGVDGGTAQMCLAEGNADLSAYKKYLGNPVVSTPPAPYTSNDFRDPFIWKENGTWYMIIGTGLGGSGTSGGAALLYKSSNLINWQYLDVLFKGFPQSDNSGIFWEVPMFLGFGEKKVFTAQPVPQPGAPARILYWTGAFQNEKFIPDNTQPNLLEPGDNLLGVTTTTDPQGRLVAIGIIPDILPDVEQRKNGWANLMSLPRVWSLSPDGKKLHQQPLPELSKLRGKNYHWENLSVNSSQTGLLPGVHGLHLEIHAKIDPGTASRVGLVLAKNPDNSERTRLLWEVPFNIFQIDRSGSSSNLSAPKGNIQTLINRNPGQLLDLHIFLDGSVLEVFLNNELALSTRIYPEKIQSSGLDIFTQGGTANLVSLDIWEMKSMHDPTVTGLKTLSPAKKKQESIIEQVFPNPFSNALNIELNLPKGGEIEVVISDVLGKKITARELGYFPQGKQTFQISAINLPKGQYVLEVRTNHLPAGFQLIIKP